jgi:hypothetical protein
LSSGLPPWFMLMTMNFPFRHDRDTILHSLRIVTYSTVAIWGGDSNFPNRDK